jgi:AraC-like DNA-binding protein
MAPAAEVPLAHSAVSRTHDLDEARDVLAHLYYPHRLETVSRPPLDLVLNAVVGQEMTLAYCAFGTDARLDAPSLADCYQFNLTLTGQTMVRFRHQRRDVATKAGVHGVIYSPTDAVVLEWPADVAQLVLKVSSSALHDHLSGLLGVPVSAPVTFDPLVDLHAAPGARLSSAVTFYAAELDRFEQRTNSLIERQFEDLIMTSLLLSSEHDYSQRLDHSDDFPQSSVVREALDFIHDHLAEPIGVTDIARACRVSARTLQVAFSRNVGFAPMTVVRDLRLAQVHAELREGVPESVTVSNVATKWGFPHQGHFGQLYRSRYDCRPIDTLRRNG